MNVASYYYSSYRCCSCLKFLSPTAARLCGLETILELDPLKRPPLAVADLQPSPLAARHVWRPERLDRRQQRPRRRWRRRRGLRRCTWLPVPAVSARLRFAITLRRPFACILRGTSTTCLGLGLCLCLRLRPLGAFFGLISGPLGFFLTNFVRDLRSTALDATLAGGHFGDASFRRRLYVWAPAIGACGRRRPRRPGWKALLAN